MKLKLGEGTWRQAGEAAGTIYQHLALKGPKTFAELTHEVKAKEGLTFMALGWLAREDKIVFQEDGRVSLNGEHG